MLDLPVIFHFHILILCAFPILSIMSTCFFYNKQIKGRLLNRMKSIKQKIKFRTKESERVGE